MSDTVQFSPTKTFGIHMEIDEPRQLIRVGYDNSIHSYDELLGCEKIFQTGLMGRSLLARAFSSGFFDPQTVTVTKLGVKITWQSGETYLPLVITPTRSNTPMYKTLNKQCDDIVATLEAIIPTAEKENSSDYP